MFSSEIDLSGTDLTSVHPKLLANVVCQLRQARLRQSLASSSFFASQSKLYKSDWNFKGVAGRLVTNPSAKRDLVCHFGKIGEIVVHPNP